MRLRTCSIILLLSMHPAAAERGDGQTQFQQARASLLGEGVPKDVDKAFELMKSAAAHGHPDAIGGLGYFYSVGIAVEKDDKLATEYFRKGAELGSAKSRFNLGKMLLAAKQVDEGLAWMKKAADQSLPEAALAYGSILYFGDHGVTKNYDLAAPYFRIAAEAELLDAQNFLGMMGELGLGVPVDAAAAGQWFSKAAARGQVKAQANLGRNLGPLADDRGTRIEALAWLTVAADQGEASAIKLLEESLPSLKDGDLEAAKIRADELRKMILSGARR